MKLKLKARFHRSDARTTTDYGVAIFHRSLRTQRNEGCGTSRGEQSPFWVEVAVSKDDGHRETRKYREKNWYARPPVRPPR
jgi:hypothetical protein